jgi:peptidoglycan hydrolase CwlO-like protein
MTFSIPYVGIIVRGIKSTIGVILILALAFFLFHRSWQKEKEAGDAELDKIKDEIRQLKDEVETGGNTVDDIKAEIERLKREMAGDAEAVVQAAYEIADTTENAAEAAIDVANGHE